MEEIRMNVHDRGTMKWVSLMLPEHVELLKDVFVERPQKPVLDDQKMQEIDQKLKYGLQHQVHLSITYYREGYYFTLNGKIDRIDQYNGYIVLENQEGILLPLTEIMDVEIPS